MSAAPDASRASVLTPAGRGAVAVVSAAGQGAVAAVDANFRAANGRPFAQQERNRIVFGHWASGDHREEVILLRGEDDSIEIHCHGGVAATGRIVDALTADGCRPQSWEEWLEQARDGSIAVEADHALALATTRRAAAILLDQRDGALVQAVNAVLASLDEGDAAGARQMLTVLIERSTIGLHLTQPWQVAIAGRPNVGKSSLINALVGYQRAIVFDQPGTTRDVLSAETAIDGWPVRLTDAAGIRDTVDPLEAEGVTRARRQLSQADLVLWVLDASVLDEAAHAFATAERELAEEAGETATRILPRVVLNKVDLLPQPPRDLHGEVIATSALSGAGVDQLLEGISRRLVPKPPIGGAGVPFIARHRQCLQLALSEIDSGNLPAAANALYRLLSGQPASE